MQRPFIFEGLDGAGKTTLLTGVEKNTGISVLPRLSPVEDKRIRDIISNENISVQEIHRLYMVATYKHLTEVVYPKIKSGDLFLLDRWIAGMIATHVLRGGTLADWTINNFDWSPVKLLDCIFVRSSTEVRNKRATERGSLTKSDQASFDGDAETTHLKFAQHFYRRIITLEAFELSREDLLKECLRVLKI